jgi:hypothetical protein
MGLGCSNTVYGGTTLGVKTLMPHVIEAALTGHVKEEDISIPKIAVIPSDVSWPTAVSILLHPSANYKSNVLLKAQVLMCRLSFSTTIACSTFPGWNIVQLHTNAHRGHTKLESLMKQCTCAQ